MQRSLIIGLLIALVLVVFALKNTVPIELDFIIGNPVKGTLSLILLITLIIGIFVGLMLSYPSNIKLKKKLADNEKEIIKISGILEDYKKEYGISKNKQPDKSDDYPKEL